jgi:hypothetical protein
VLGRIARNRRTREQIRVASNTTCSPLAGADRCAVRWGQAEMARTGHGQAPRPMPTRPRSGSWARLGRMIIDSRRSDSGNTPVADAEGWVVASGAKD